MNIIFLEKRARRSKFTRTRLNVLIALNSHIEAVGYSPTVRELALSLGVKSHSSVQFQLDVLEEQGYIARRARRARSTALTSKAYTALYNLSACSLAS